MLGKLAEKGILGAFEELGQHPWTTLTALAAIAFALLNFYGKARADELIAVKQEVANLKDQVAETSQKVDELAASLLEGKLIEARLRYCAASKANSEPTKFYRDLTADLSGRYRELTGREYHLPSCSEV